MVIGLCGNFNICFLQIKPYFKNIIDNEYVLRYSSCVLTIFIVVIFLILLVNKGISKAVNYTGIGGIRCRPSDSFLDLLRAYIIG